MRKPWLALFATLLLVTFVAGCHSSNSDSSTTKKAEIEKPKRPIPADSPFALVKEGMGSDEVFTKIGQPTSQSHYVTGKAWIPFHFSGSDTHRMAAHYKGLGIITFGNDSAYTSGMSVVDIEYDPNETGYEKKE